MADFDPQIIYRNPTYTVKDMLYRAYRMAGALKNPGQGISNSESQEGLDVLNSMIDGWKIEGLMMEYTRRTLQNTVVNQQSYSVGPGQDWDLERPEKIHRAGFIVAGSPNAEIPMRILLTFEEWAAYIVKQVGGPYPLALYYVPAVPYGQANLWPVPNFSPQQLAIYTPQLLSEFNSPDDQVIMKDGYREMLQYNLAVAVHQMYPEKAWDGPTVINQADYYKQRVKANGFTPLFIQSDEGARQNTGSRDANSIPGLPRSWIPY